MAQRQVAGPTVDGGQGLLHEGQLREAHPPVLQVKQRHCPPRLALQDKNLVKI